MSCVNSVRVVPSRLTLTHHDTFSGLQAIVDTNGSDCCGVRWTSGDTKVVKVNGQTGAIEAVGVGTTYVKAKAIDGSGKYGCCMVTVEQLHVTGVESCPNNRGVRVGEHFNLSAWVYPSKATNTSVTFTSNNTNIATVSAAGKVVGVSEGRTSITITTEDGEYMAYCNVEVLPPVTATGIELSVDYLELDVDETKQVMATVKPWNAANKTVSWYSSDMYVATVDSEGKVTGHNDGEATITARTIGGGHSATCTVRVDSREKVLVEREGDYFTVTFVDGTVWKSIGCDMNENKSGKNLWNPDEYDSLHEYERRYLHNREQEKQVKSDMTCVRDGYTEERVAFLYLLDPLGVGYFMQDYSDIDSACDEIDRLLKIDRIYLRIFGVWPQLIIPTEEGEPVQRIAYSSNISRAQREYYYSDAELIFGAHQPSIPPEDFERQLAEIIVQAMITIFLSKYETFSNFLTLAEMMYVFFFSGAVQGMMTEGTQNVVEEYVKLYLHEELIEPDMKKKDRLLGICDWGPKALLFVANLAVDVANATIMPELGDIQIYKAVQNNSMYNVRFGLNDTEVPMGYFIQLCERAMN